MRPADRNWSGTGEGRASPTLARSTLIDDGGGDMFTQPVPSEVNFVGVRSERGSTTRVRHESGPRGNVGLTARPAFAHGSQGPLRKFGASENRC